MSVKSSLQRHSLHPSGAYRRRPEARIAELADEFAPRGMDRRSFLRTGCGTAVDFLACNAVRGPFFSLAAAEAADPQAAAGGLKRLSSQFIFDAQLHFVNEECAWGHLLGLRRAAFAWNPDLEPGSLSASVPVQKFRPPGLSGEQSRRRRRTGAAGRPAVGGQREISGRCA